MTQPMQNKSMRNNNKFIRSVVIFYLFMTISYANAQAGRFETIGDQSPIIKGVSNQIKYYNKEKKNITIPDGVLPLLAGVMIINKKDPKSDQFASAIRIWIEKYVFLNEQINKIGDSNQKQIAIKSLAEGNFPAVEKIINTVTSYDEFERLFPASYQTTGKQSPILIGDNSTVSYVITKIIDYKLPESLTQNILDKIYAQDKKISELSFKLSKRDDIINEWIIQYQKLEKQLSNSPDSISQKSLAFFRKGDLDSALKEIEKINANNGSIGRISLLKANILLLKFDYLHYEQSYEEINKNLLVAMILENTTTAEAIYTYAQFLADYSFDQPKKIEILNSAYDKIPKDSITQKIMIAQKLSEVYIDLQQYIIAEQWLIKTRNLSYAISDEGFREQSMFRLHIILGKFYGLNNQLDKCEAHCDSALVLCDKNPDLKDNMLQSWYTAKLNKITAKINQSLVRKDAINLYINELKYAEKELTTSVSDQMFIIQRYAYIAIMLSETGDLENSKKILYDNSNRLRAYVNPQNQFYLNMYFINWLSLINILSRGGYFAEWEKELLQMEDLLNQMASVMPNPNILTKQSRLDIEFAIYYKTQKNYPTALEKFQKGFDFLINNLSQNPAEFASFISGTIDNIGECYEKMYKTSEGINYLKSIILIAEKYQKLDDRNYAATKIKIFRQIGALYQLEGKVDSSRIFLQKGLKDAELRFSDSNPVILFEYIYLSRALSSSFYNVNNDECLIIMNNCLNKLNNYLSLNPWLRQLYLNELAYTTGNTAQMYLLTKNYYKWNELHLETQKLFLEKIDSTFFSKTQHVIALIEYCNILANVDYHFPNLSKSERTAAGIKKCNAIEECLKVLYSLPDSAEKNRNIAFVNSLKVSCK
jgi:hypothetical protein